MLAIALMLGVVAIVAVYYASKVSMGTGADLRGAVFTQVQTFSANEMNRFGTASLITRNTNDIQQTQLFLQMALTLMVIAPIMCVGAYTWPSGRTPLSLLLVVAVPVMMLVLGVVMVMVVPQFRSMQVKIDRITEVLREQITGVRVIRAFVRGHSEAERFDKANSSLTATTLRVSRIFALTMPALMAILNLSSAAVVWFGGNLVSDGSMPIGNLTAFLTYILQILMSVMMVILVPRAMARAEPVQQVLDATPSITSSPAPVRPKRATGMVELRDLTFGYPGSEQPVLHDLSLTFLSGQTSAIIGGTGSGKTTLLNLVPRFSDATSGSLLVNGVDVRDQELEQLWDSIGLVPQFAFLFSGTVASKPAFWQTRGDRSRAVACPRGCSGPRLRRGYARPARRTDRPGRHQRLGGQRQRLFIARALVKRPRLYLFDDCFSALDAGTDAKLRAALKAETHDAAVVIVAQRVSTVMHADQIIVLGEGRVAGMGAHKDLMLGCDPYWEIVISQLGEQAAAA